jgi:hypothetical protein
LDLKTAWKIVKKRFMKKISFISCATSLTIIIAVLFMSCQKEQSSATEDNIATEGRIVGVAGTGGSYAGSVNTSYAASLAANYAKKYGDDKDQTQSVAFSAKDLVSFINSLQTKYKSDIIYVNFGVYGKGAKPVNAKDWNRLTVFFTGNNMPTATGNKKNDGTEDDGSDQFLNHGTIYP